MDESSLILWIYYFGLPSLLIALALVGLAKLYQGYRLRTQHAQPLSRYAIEVNFPQPNFFFRSSFSKSGYLRMDRRSLGSAGDSGNRIFTAIHLDDDKNSRLSPKFARRFTRRMVDRPDCRGLMNFNKLIRLSVSSVQCCRRGLKPPARKTTPPEGGSDRHAIVFKPASTGVAW